MSTLTIRMPMYEGDSIIRRGLSTPVGPTTSTAPSAPATPVAAPALPRFDIDEMHRIERAAHRMRAEAVGALLAGGWARLAAFLKGDGKSSEEQYLARSTDLVDLEMRQREVARSNRFRTPLGRPAYL